MPSRKQMLRRIAEPSTRGYTVTFPLVCAAALTAAICRADLWINVTIIVAGLLVFIVQFSTHRRSVERHRRELSRYIDDVALGGDAAKNAVMELPFPMVVVRSESGDILWANKSFHTAAGTRPGSFEKRIGDIFPGIDTSRLMAGRRPAPFPIEVGGRSYEVHGVASVPTSKMSQTGTLFFVDTTEQNRIHKEYEKSRPVVGIVLIDAYDEITKNLSETQKSSVIADIDALINGWVADKKCMLKRYDRDKYLVICTQSVLDEFIEDKFSILDSVRGIVSRDIPVTLSLGFGMDGDLHTNHTYALIAIDMALSRGGDQAVVKNEVNFSFFGGRTQELERRTKVKSRVMANALKQLIDDSSDIIVMGHKNSDLDSIGASAGVVCAGRTLGRPAYIVIDRERTAAAELIGRLERESKYEGVFISPSEAMVKLNARSLLVVVDTNRPEVVESPELLMSANRVAVIDHHRRAASYIEEAALSMHEPYASSASELVSELLGYFDIGNPLLRVEADALLAGIVLDTKNFTIRTGVRTFEAAAALRMAGADTVEIKRMFQTDFESYLNRYKITGRAIMYKKTMAISMLEYTVDRVTAAQAADELLTISGVQASFVLFPENDAIIISARSLGEVNVQVIMEKLGGGGHLNMAGAQISDETLEYVLTRLYAALDEYIENTKQKG